MIKKLAINFLKVFLIATISFTGSYVVFYILEQNKGQSFYSNKSKINLHQNSNSVYVASSPMIRIDSYVSNKETKEFNKNLQIVELRNEVYHSSLKTGNYIGYSTATKLKKVTTNKKEQQQMINLHKLFNYKTEKYGDFFGITVNEEFTLETVDPDLHWEGQISFVDQIKPEKFNVQIDGISFVKNEETYDARLRIANNYIGDGKWQGGIFFLRTDMTKAFNLLEKGTSTFAYTVGFRDSHEKLHNIQTGIEQISKNITEDTNSKEGQNTLSMLDLSDIIYPEIAYQEYMEGWAAIENGLGVRALGGGVCAAISGQWYLLNNMLDANKINYQVLSHQNHLDKNLNPIPYIPGSAMEINPVKTDATVYSDKYITLDASMQINDNVSIQLKPNTLIYDPFESGRLVMVISGEITVN